MAFGIDRLTKYLTARLDTIDLELRLQCAALKEIGRHMATRADFDNLKAILKTDIATIVQSVKDLQAQLAAGTPITDQDLLDLQDDINTLTGGAPVPPTP